MAEFDSASYSSETKVRTVSDIPLPGTICSIHPGEKITHYCKTHSRVCCKHCKKSEHYQCDENVAEISDFVSSKKKINEDHKEFKNKLCEMRLKFNKTKKKASAHLKEVDEMYQDASTTFKKALDKLRDAEKNKLKNIVSSSEKALKEVNDLEEKASAGSTDTDENCAELFAFMKTHTGKLETMSKDFLQMHVDNRVTRYDFVNGENSKHVYILGPLVKKPCLVNELNVHYRGEEKTCVITDIALLGSDLLLVSDRANKSIKLVDIKRNQVISQTNPSKHFPHQMAVTDDGDIYVTIPNAKAIKKLTIKESKIREDETILTQGSCFAIEYQKNKLKMQECSLACSYKIVEFDLYRKAVKTVVEHLLPSEKSRFFDRFKTAGPPLYSVAEQNSGDTIYSCHRQNSIVAVSCTGQTKTVIESEKLRGPHGIEFDRDESLLLVASTETKQVFSVTEDGCISEFLPIPLDFKPVSLRMDRKTGLLYIGGINDSVLMVAT